MFSGASSEELSLGTTETYPFGEQEKIFGEIDWYGNHGEAELYETDEVPDVRKHKSCICEGDYLPCGPRLYFESNEMIRMKDVCERRRILLLGVIGSFTPYCWNRHLFRVLNKSRYYEERGVDFICCLSTNDAFTQSAWASHLGCRETIFMLADPSKAFTKAIGMDIVIPWLDSTVRSKRYIIFVENMKVIKMIVAADDGPHVKLECEHLRTDNPRIEEDEESDSDFYV